MRRDPLAQLYAEAERADREVRIPYVTEAQVQKLSEMFPPRCRLPGENELLHERYAGKVELIAMLRAQLDEYGEDTGIDIDDLTGDK